MGLAPWRARDIIAVGLNKFGPSADLLWALAEVEFVAGDVAAGNDAMKEVLALDPPSPTSTTQQLRMLSGCGCWRDALSTVFGIPESRDELGFAIGGTPVRRDSDSSDSNSDYDLGFPQVRRDRIRLSQNSDVEEFDLTGLPHTKPRCMACRDWSTFIAGPPLVRA
jgi:hypothetical protein